MVFRGVAEALRSSSLLDDELMAPDLRPSCKDDAVDDDDFVLSYEVLGLCSPAP